MRLLLILTSLLLWVQLSILAVSLRDNSACLICVVGFLLLLILVLRDFRLGRTV
jgi:hypothetical protein